MALRRYRQPPLSRLDGKWNLQSASAMDCSLMRASWRRITPSGANGQFPSPWGRNHVPLSFSRETKGQM
jgi:hypothetical protein